MSECEVLIWLGKAAIGFGVGAAVLLAYIGLLTVWRFIVYGDE